MAQPNQLNPYFQGPVKALGYEAVHGGGISSTARRTNSTTVQALFGSTTVGFSGTITSFYIIAEGGLNATITLSMGGLVVSTILQGTTTRAMLGPSTAFTPTTFTAGQTIGVYSSSTHVSGRANCIVTYAVKNPSN